MDVEIRDIGRTRFVQNPQNATAGIGHIARFECGAYGLAANQRQDYQWEISRNAGATWADILNATSPVLLYPCAAGDNGALIRCKFAGGNVTVSGPDGNYSEGATSGAATLTLS